jgi:hypothetical protein
MNRALLVAVVAATLLLGGTALVALPTADGGAAGLAQADGPLVGTVASSLFEVQEARTAGTVELETLRVRIERANVPTERAGVLADALDDVETDVDTLETRLERLRTARENGSLPEGGFAVRVAPVASAARARGALLEHVAATAGEIDDATLRAAGAAPDRIASLRERVDRVAQAGRGALEADGLGRAFYRRIVAAAERHNRETAGENLGLLGSYLRGERINLRIRTGNGDAEVVSFRTTRTMEVRELRAGPHPDASLRVTTDAATASEIANDTTPARAASEAFLDGEISIDGLGLWNALKWALITAAVELVRAVLGVVEWFVSLLP